GKVALLRTRRSKLSRLADFSRLATNNSIVSPPYRGRDRRRLSTAEVNAVLQQKAAGMFKGANATGPANVSRLQGTLAAFQSMMAMSSASAVHTVRQAMLVNAMDDGLMRFIATSGNSAAMDIYQVARADIQTRS